MNALDVMRQDHARIKTLFDNALKNDDRTARAGLLHQIRTELMAHDKMKDDIFYPALRAGGDKAKDVVIEGTVEHHIIEVILDSLLEVPEDTEQWQAKLKVLKANLEEHIQNEEDRVFSRAKDALGDATLEELGRQMEDRRIE